MYETFRRLAPKDGDTDWETLADMRHCGVPTRHLDWSTSLGVALFFAVERFHDVFATENCKDIIDFARSIVWTNVDAAKASKSVAEVVFAKRKTGGFDIVGDNVRLLQGTAELLDVLCREEIVTRKSNVFLGLRAPSVWICNPFRLAKEEFSIRREIGFDSGSTGIPRIYDVAANPSWGFYPCFASGVKTWPFVLPVPSQTSLRDARRTAQEAHLVIYGDAIDPLPMDVLFSTEAITSVSLSGSDIIGALWLVRTSGIDAFSVYRDRDSLGKRIRDMFNAM